MTKIDLPQLPFVTREMLEFGNKATLELSVDIFDRGGNDLTLRGMTREDSFVYEINSAVSASLQTFDFGIADIPIFMTLIGKDSNSQVGKVTAAVYLQINGNRVLLMAEGMPSFLHGISWPSNVPPGPLNTKGEISTLSISDPAVGADLTATLQNYQWFHIKALQFTFTADANAANRMIRIALGDGSATVAYGQAPGPIVANETIFVNASVGVTALDNTAFGNMQISLPADFWIPPSGAIDTTTVNIQAGDQISTIWAGGEFIYNPL